MLTVFYIGTLIREEAQGSGERGDLHTYPHGKESLKVKNRSPLLVCITYRRKMLDWQWCWYL